MEDWARGLRITRSLTDLVSTEPAVHDRFRGQGWLHTFATTDAGVWCTAGRAYLAVLAVGDDNGFTYDTILQALICHNTAAVPADLKALFQRLPGPRH